MSTPAPIQARQYFDKVLKCSVEACNRPYCAKGFCNTHYNRNRRVGSPTGTSRATLSERLIRRLQPEGECLVWTGFRQADGYGVMGIDDRKTERTHRVAWEIAHGSIPPGSQVLHRCDNPPCCNPDHLFLGDPAANAADKVAKGRCNPPKGEAAAHSKLTAAKVEIIRARWAAGGVSKSQLGRDFGVSHVAIRQIVERRSWR